MEDLEAVNLAADWADISQGLRKDLGHQLYSQWIKPIQVGGIDKDSGRLDLFLPTEFSANWVKDRFADRLSLCETPPGQGCVEINPVALDASDPVEHRLAMPGDEVASPSRGQGGGGRHGPFPVAAVARMQRFFLFS